MKKTLFCKPAGTVAYTKGEIAFVSFDPAKHLATIHDWVNRPYASQFWDMAGSLGAVRSCYQCIQQNPYAHSFIGLLNGEPICQIDVYLVSADELAAHINARSGDCGFHLLMAPNEKPIPGLTRSLLKAFLDHFFSFSRARAMYAEPEVINKKSIPLLKAMGFKKVKTIQLSYKKAYLYRLTRTAFKKL